MDRSTVRSRRNQIVLVLERLKRLSAYKPVPIAKFPVYRLQAEKCFRIELEGEDEHEETVMHHSN
jgi:hypothetical protein